MRLPPSNYDMTDDYRHLTNLTNLIANCFIEAHVRPRFFEVINKKVTEKIELFINNDRQRIFVDTIEEINEEFKLELMDISVMLKDFIKMSRNVDETVQSFVERIQKHVHLMFMECERLLMGEMNALLWYLDHMAKEVYIKGKYNLNNLTAEQEDWYLEQCRILNLELLELTKL